MGGEGRLVGGCVRFWVALGVGLTTASEVLVLRDVGAWRVPSCYGFGVAE